MRVQSLSPCGIELRCNRLEVVARKDELHTFVPPPAPDAYLIGERQNERRFPCRFERHTSRAYVAHAPSTRGNHPVVNRVTTDDRFRSGDGIWGRGDAAKREPSNRPGRVRCNEPIIVGW